MKLKELLETTVKEVMTTELITIGPDDTMERAEKLLELYKFSHIPVVAITAHGNAEMEDLALAVGCVGFLHKPADIRQIRAVLHKYLNMETAVAAPIAEKTASPIYAYI